MPFGALLGIGAGVAGGLLGGLGARARRDAEGSTNAAMEEALRHYSNRARMIREAEQADLSRLRGGFAAASQEALNRLTDTPALLARLRQEGAGALAGAGAGWRGWVPAPVAAVGGPGADPYVANAAQDLARMALPGQALQAQRWADLARPAYDARTRGGLQSALADLARQRRESGALYGLERARADANLDASTIAYQNAMRRAQGVGESTRQVGGFISGLGGGLLGGAVGGGLGGIFG